MFPAFFLVLCAWFGLSGAQTPQNLGDADRTRSYGDWRTACLAAATVVLSLFLVYLSLLSVAFLGPNMAYLTVGCHVGTPRRLKYTRRVWGARCSPNLLLVSLALASSATSIALAFLIPKVLDTSKISFLVCSPLVFFFLNVVIPQHVGSENCLYIAGWSFPFVKRLLQLFWLPSFPIAYIMREHDAWRNREHPNRKDGWLTNAQLFRFTELHQKRFGHGGNLFQHGWIRLARIWLVEKDWEEKGINQTDQEIREMEKREWREAIQENIKKGDRGAHYTLFSRYLREREMEEGRVGVDDEQLSSTEPIPMGHLAQRSSDQMAAAEISTSSGFQLGSQPSTNGRMSRRIISSEQEATSSPEPSPGTEDHDREASVSTIEESSEKTNSTYDSNASTIIKTSPKSNGHDQITSSEQEAPSSPEPSPGTKDHDQEATVSTIEESPEEANSTYYSNASTTIKTSPKSNGHDQITSSEQEATSSPEPSQKSSERHITTSTKINMSPSLEPHT